uniref:Wsv039 n=1 Tax=White spot syndrome virus TaxID=92652 RepID=A0A2U9GEI2_WSSV|nr:wsv039 [Shrimp white spot syndrome virus]AWQ60646.1 wsv039 [Shrimp white spot syndrome virus]AWQ61095.1 wsv039 [Shrimp white spot syndrome virus]AWQ61493.1 wsv039 [Shrimp white spot syndrome virus]AWQ62777.1 wsv039 [Shrimp white spot syndrome virus]
MSEMYYFLVTISVKNQLFWLIFQEGEEVLISGRSLKLSSGTRIDMLEQSVMKLMPPLKTLL